MDTAGMKRRRSPSPSSSMEAVYSFSSRIIRPLPKTRRRPPTRDLKPKLHPSLLAYRSIASETDASTDTQLDTTDTELGTALSDVESEIRHEKESSPALEDGDEVDDALTAKNGTLSSPPPEPSWYPVDRKGKAVDSTEKPLLKKRRIEQESESDDGDDEKEAESCLIMRNTSKRPIKRPSPLNLVRSNLGPTRSILEITARMDGLAAGTEVDITYSLSSDSDDEAREISAHLTAVPPSPTPVKRIRPRIVDKGNNSKRGLGRRAHPLLNGRNFNRVRNHARLHRVWYTKACDLSKQEETAFLPSSLVERPIPAHKNVARLPGQRTRSKLRRSSPTSIRPMRSKRKTRPVASKEVSIRTHHRLPLPVPRVHVGQILLSIILERVMFQRERRDLVKRANKAAEGYWQMPDWVFIPAWWTKPVPSATEEENAVDRLLSPIEVRGDVDEGAVDAFLGGLDDGQSQRIHKRRASVIEDESDSAVRSRPRVPPMATEDARSQRIMAVYSRRHNGAASRRAHDRARDERTALIVCPVPVRGYTHPLVLGFRSPPTCPSRTLRYPTEFIDEVEQALEPIQHVDMAIGSPTCSVVESIDDPNDAVSNGEQPSSPARSDPPEYDDIIPISLPIAPRRRAAPALPQTLPEYVWPLDMHGHAYHPGRTPSPPPPFNAVGTTLLVAPIFLDDDDEDEMTSNASGLRDRPSQVDEREPSPEPVVIGAFPGSRRLPLPVRTIRHRVEREFFEPRNSFDAGLDMEEGVDEEDEEEEVAAPEEEAGGLGGVVRSWLGRLWGR